MNLSEYLETDGIQFLDTTKIPSIVLADEIEYPKNKSGETFVEIDLDDIEDYFPIPFVVSSFPIGYYFEQIFYNKDTILSNYPFSRFDSYMELLFKEGKYYPCPNSNLTAIYLIIAYIKQLKREHPEIKMPILTCKVYDFELSEEDKI